MKSTISRHFFKVMLGGLIVLLFSTTACQRSSDTVAPSLSDNSSQEMMISLPDGAPANLQDGSLEIPIMGMVPMSDFNRFGLHIFPCLKLTKGQIDSIRTFVKNYEDCVHGVLDSLRNSEKAILQNANAQRKTILDAFHNGTMDTATARASLKALNAATRDALKNNPVRSWAQTEMQHCRETLDAAIRSILTSDQQIIWDNWINKGIDCKGRPEDNGHHGQPGDTTGRPPHPPIDSTGRPPFPPKDSTGRPPHPPIDSTGRPHGGPDDGHHGHKG